MSSAEFIRFNLMDCVRIVLLVGLLLVVVGWDRLEVDSASSDRVSPPTAARVKQLVEHFELIEKSSQDVNVAQSTSVILSLSQSATKLYKLIHGLAQDVKCNRYIRLIKMPDIRTVATISALVKETGELNEQVQTDANLIARLTSERDFDSIGRIQLIIQTIDSEKTFGKSNFEPNVEEELFDCVNYYIYRQQKALISVIEHVRHSMENLSKHLIKPTESEIFVEKITGLIERIVAMEQANDREDEFNFVEWLELLSRLHSMALQNNFEVPQLARDILADRRRVDRLNLWLESDKLKNEIFSMESKLSWFNKRTSANQAYHTALHKLDALCSSSDVYSRPPAENCKILSEPRRSGILKELSNGSVKPQEPPIERDFIAARQMEPIGENFQEMKEGSGKGNQVLPSKSDKPERSPCIDSLFDKAWSLSGDKQDQIELCASNELLGSKNNVDRSSQQKKLKKRWFWQGS